MNYLKRNLNIKNINIKHFRITNRFLRNFRNNRETHCQYIYLFTYLSIYLFTYLFIYFMLAFTIKSIKTVIYTFHYIQIAIQMVFNKQICMLIYVNQNNREK